MGADKRNKVYLAIAIAVTILSAAYWSAYGINAYSTFNEFGDLGINAYAMYYHIHYPSVVGGLGYLVFWGHVAPDQLLVLPVFFLYQSAITLLLFQAVLMSLTGLLIFFVVQKLLGSSAWALVFCIIFLINPGTHGIMIFDYHVEDLLVPFTILAFYFYMKINRPWFFASFALLLGALEFAPIIGFSLALGLFTFDFLHTKDKRIRTERIKLAVSAILLSVLAFLIYLYIISNLSSAYAASYASIPGYFKVIQLLPQQLGLFYQNVASGTSGLSYGAYGIYIFYGLLVGIFCFGILVLSDPLVTLLLTLPWIVEVLIIKDFSFTFISLQDYSYVLGGTVVAAILGLILISENKGIIVKMLGRKNPAILPLVKSTLLFINFAILAFSPLLLVSNVNPHVTDIWQAFLFQSNSTQEQAYSQLYSIINMIPDNASVMAPHYLSPHLFAREYYEWPQEQYVFFKPEYIVVDFNTSVATLWQFGYAYPMNEQQFTANYINQNGYYLYAENGSAQLWKAA